MATNLTLTSENDGSKCLQKAVEEVREGEYVFTDPLDSNTLLVEGLGDGEVERLGTGLLQMVFSGDLEGPLTFKVH